MRSNRGAVVGADRASGAHARGGEPQRAGEPDRRAAREVRGGSSHGCRATSARAAGAREDAENGLRVLARPIPSGRLEQFHELDARAHNRQIRALAEASAPQTITALVASMDAPHVFSGGSDTGTVVRLLRANVISARLDRRIERPYCL